MLLTTNRAARVAIAVLLATLGATVVAQSSAIPGARAAATPIYNSIPAVYPPSFPSLGYQAQSTREFGDHVVLGGGSRFLETMTIGLTNWACGSDYTLTQPGNVWVPAADPGPCITTPGSTFVHPITLTIFAVDNTGLNPAAGAVLTTLTQSVTVPFRPSADVGNCTVPIVDPLGRRWFNVGTGTCHNGYAFNVDFDLTSLNLELPDEVIISVAYNTQSWGSAPIGAPGPYNSLNVSLASAPATVGSGAEPDVMFRDFAGSGFLRETGWAAFFGFVMELNANPTATSTGPELAAAGADVFGPIALGVGFVLAGFVVLVSTKLTPRRR